MSYLVLARKWRPQTFDDLIGQEPVCRILKNAIKQNKVSHAYIFSGPRGVGKTSAARILSKALNCETGPTDNPCGNCLSCRSVSSGSGVDVIEIDAASNTGVENIRDLRERVKYAPSFGSYKIYIIDEAHMLSTSAFNAFLKTLEEPPAHIVFVLATTEPRKIPLTVLSRCQHFSFKRISHSKIRERLEFISKSEGMKVSASAIELIARAADGSMRDSLTILDQLLSFSNEITESDVKDLFGFTDVEILSHLVSAVIDGDRRIIIGIISRLTDSGADMKIITRDLLLFIRKLLILKITREEEDTIDFTEKELKELNLLGHKTSEEHIALLFSELLKAEPYIRNAYYPRAAFEIALIKLSLLSHFKSIDEAIRHIGLSHMAKDNLSHPGKGAPSEPKARSRLSTFDDAVTGDTEIKDVWNKTIEKIGETNHLLACRLKEGFIFFKDDKICITYKGGNSIHEEPVKKSLDFIKKTIHGLSGKDIDIALETIKGQPANKDELKEKALKNPIIQEALQLFDGRILDVIPINNEAGGNDV